MFSWNCLYPSLIISWIRPLASWSFKLAHSQWQRMTHWTLFISLTFLRTFSYPFVTWVCKHHRATSSMLPFLSEVLVEWDMNQTTSCVPQATYDGTGTTTAESRFIWSVSCHPCAHLLTQPTIKSPRRRSSTLRATLSASSFKTNSRSRGAWWKRVFW